MAFIETISPEQAGPELTAMYQRQQAKYGYLPNYAKVFCYRPDTMKLWANLLAGIRGSESFQRNPKHFLLVTFAAARALKSESCMRAYRKMLGEYFSSTEVAAIAAGDTTAPLTEAEQAMMRFAEKVALDATTTTAEDVANLKQLGLTDADIFDVVAAAAGRAFFTKVLDGLGVTLDAPGG